MGGQGGQGGNNQQFRPSMSGQVSGPQFSPTQYGAYANHPQSPIGMASQGESPYPVNNYFTPQNQFRGNAFSPMNAADWAALENQYYPPPEPGVEKPSPRPGTIEHYRLAGGSPSDNTGSSGYANYMSAMATLYGTSVEATNTGGQGGQWMVGQQEVNDQYAYEYQGQIYNKHQGVIGWANELAWNKRGDIADYNPASPTDTLFGPSSNPDFVGSIGKMVAGWFGITNPEAWDTSSSGFESGYGPGAFGGLEGAWGPSADVFGWQAAMSEMFGGGGEGASTAHGTIGIGEDYDYDETEGGG